MMQIRKQLKHNKLLMIISILIVILVVLLISKITYAYLDRPEGTPGITEGKITASGDKLIFTKGNDLALALSTDNFNYETKGNITTSTNPKVTLITNSKTKDATAKYSTGINIIQNTFVSSDETPELILQVKCDNEEITKIENLEYNETLKGFDITNKTGIFNAAVDKEITSNDSSIGTTHTWEYTIILINKEIDQSINETAEFKAKVYIAEKIPIEEVLLADANKDGKITLYHHNVEDLTDPNMPNKDKIAGDDSYRYSGSDTDVKNYVCLDSKTTGKCETDEDLYRIIGLFKNSEGQYEMKLIKATIGTAKELGDSNAKKDIDPTPSAYLNGDYYYWNSSLGVSNDDNNVNMWKESNLNKVNLNSFYFNYITEKVKNLSNHITNHIWVVGNNSISSYSKEIYDNDIGINKVKKTDSKCYNQGDINTSRLCNEENDLIYQDKIGLMYISDYMYGTIPNNWTTTKNNYSLDNVKDSNWLFIKRGEWTISRVANSSNIVQTVNYKGYASSNLVNSDGAGVRPTFYLSSDVKLKEGEGTKEIPYRITFE